MRMLKTLMALAAVFTVTTASAQAPAASGGIAAQKRVTFLACPIFRDAARQCWLAEHGGERYYIGRILLGTMPQLLHQVLVEGVVSDEPRSCGGIVLQPVQVSVMPELDRSCDTVLPDNGEHPSEPSRFDMTAEQLSLIGAAQPPPQPPFKDQFTRVPFDFDSDFLNQETQQVVERIARYAVASKARRIRITTQAASVRLDDGRVLSEPVELAGKRADIIARSLAGLDVDASRITRVVKNQLQAADGIHDMENRDALVEVFMR